MPDPRCDHCDLPVGTCAHTPSALAAVDRDRPVVGPKTVAVYQGRCVSCGDQIDVGDRIRGVDGAWSHSEHYDLPDGPSDAALVMFEAFEGGA